METRETGNGNPGERYCGSASAHPDIKTFRGFLEWYLDSARDIISGPASEYVQDVEETMDSCYADETNRVLRVHTELQERKVSYDLVIQLSAPAIRENGSDD